MRSRAVVFDLDGTLVDSAPGIATALNHVGGLRRRISADEVRPWVSFGAGRLLQEVLGLEAGEVEPVLEAFRAHYRQAPCSASDLYPDVAGALRALKQSGYELAICTNKPQELAERVIECVRLEHLFGAVVGASSNRPAKPDPAPLRLALQRLNDVAPTALVGDSSVDAMTARAGGIPFVFAAFGYGPLDSTLPVAASFEAYPDLAAVIADMETTGDVNR